MKLAMTESPETDYVSRPKSDSLISLLSRVAVALIRSNGRGLSARQLAVFLTCYLHDSDHTVHGLAADLNITTAAITRALDRLGELDLARRKIHPRDRRSVLVQRTPRGQAFLRELQKIAAGTKAGRSARERPRSGIAAAGRSTGQEHRGRADNSKSAAA